ncbi:phosphatidylglycerophosphatase A [Glaesserella parasuis]|uniref:Phosphatidylglycerophosphatase A n=1 Tax=Glaesserella parasuis TaxID=738 RepID=A0A6I4R322_GLAPU|nr:phosphatidylglycerophosphatase A [Glaesserella parasuis]AIK17402.1 phosphatidylglycerophosphatase [Glaesserella parasuis]AIK89902.1 phosphatidylglycerophosphatase [Glaesserella parasuis]ATW45916.1 phosphatidylglycerophosphatase A [Glaesserella parasuis str. Nagasaki]AWY46010.1 phosphatidylglycerophosphatase A [Glaesserella parasuis 29755]EMY46993.1 phosphatidylglycerophosphatase A [Glaesserella parasuis gx033]
MKINLKNPIHFLAFGFGSGLIKPAPGTWGTLAGLGGAILLWHITESTLFFVLLSLITFVAGCYICDKTSHDLGVHDDGRIVWDEIVAVFVIFGFLPEHNWLYYLLTFVTFRLFDILKPYPIRYFDEHLQGGLGIMFDDILAAIYSIITLYLISWCI